jgi:LPXTG-site transpeptidase (sortase) family protein
MHLVFHKKNLFILNMRKFFSNPNFMILAGLGLLILGIGGIWIRYVQMNSPVVLANAGADGNDPYSFSPPLQAEVTNTKQTETGSDGIDPQSKTTPTPPPTGKIPDRLEIPSISLDAPILPEHYKEIFLNDQTYIQWRVPFRRASGWHDTSALLGVPGNTVLNGHHNAYGEVFKDLINLKEGDLIHVYSGEADFVYKVNTILLLPEKYQSLEERIKNANWIMPTTDERLTLFTCWPPESNTHRLIVVALPVDKQ